MTSVLVIQHSGVAKYRPVQPFGANGLTQVVNLKLISSTKLFDMYNNLTIAICPLQRACTKVLIVKIFCLCNSMSFYSLATALGRGVYFARDASYSASDRYTPPDASGHKHMYYARVLTGQYTIGNSALLVPPPKDPSNPSVLHESVVDNMQHPSIFVVFQDAHVYPEYLITFH